MDVSNKEKSLLVKIAVALGIVLCIYFAIKALYEVKNYNAMGTGSQISFDGSGEVTGSPDLAEVSVTLRSDAKGVKDAQSKVTTLEKSVLEFLEKSGIEKKDIKTENYNSYPQYDYGRPCYSVGNGYCPSATPKVIGYEVSEYISVKVRDLEKAGDVVAGLGALGVTEISGPNFSIENEDELKAEARKMAIDEAKDKAESLARDLGVKLVRIVNFSENGSYPMPLMYAKDAMGLSSMAENTAPSPDLPAGVTKITSNVVITYEIR
jgi:uncharacterized protein YggE